MIWTWVSEEREEWKSSWSGFFSHNDTDMGRRWMENKLTLEFVVNQIQDNGNTSASLVSVEHKPDRKITVSWTTKSKSIFLYYVDVEFPTHFTPFGSRCLPKSTQLICQVIPNSIGHDKEKALCPWNDKNYELRHCIMWSCITVELNKQTQMSNLSDLSINQLTLFML